MLRFFIAFYAAALTTGTALLIFWLNPEGVLRRIEAIRTDSLVLKIPRAPFLIREVVLSMPKWQNIVLSDAGGIVNVKSEAELLYVLSHTVSDRWRGDRKQIACMAYNAYFEAAGEGAIGQKRVMQVTMNRARNRGLTPCGVVYERNRNTCEFSWTCDGLPDTVRHRPAFDKIFRMAENMLNGEYFDDSYGATYYFNPQTATSAWHLTLFKKGFCSKWEGNHLFFAKKLQGQAHC